MSDLRLHLSNPARAEAQQPYRRLGDHLIDAGVISDPDLAAALAQQSSLDAPLGELLISEGLADRADVMQALARQNNLQLVDLDAYPPPSRLHHRIPVEVCMKHGIVPWLQVDDVLLVATSSPADFPAAQADMGAEGVQLLPVVADREQIAAQITTIFGKTLALAATERVPEELSCRTWRMQGMWRAGWGAGALALLGVALVLAPLWVITVLTLWALITLMMTTVLKAAALIAQLRGRGRKVPAAAPPEKLPKISVMVPLLKEERIAEVLVNRLEKLDYPRALLDIVLVLEATDEITKATLARTTLPAWMSVIEVPAAARLTTKPRALNYALDFCRGDIVGVWDAEDAPEPDQLRKIATRFAHAPENVACLQGQLDYYNSRSNWIARCFTIEYATWWRMVLPGVAKLGLVLPLGGTTLFFRRDILEKLHGWDAHNVTEDADLGVRLARKGYVTELVETTTYEEANCRAWPWVKQRSRWLKGFLITWCVHMRHPRALLRDLGFWRFMGVQTLFLATFSQFVLAPLLWVFWLTLFGMPHPIALTLGVPAMWGMITFFFVAELLNLIVSACAVSGPRHRHLMLWVVTLPAYFTLGAAAALKGLHEFVLRPFYWDKTMHGVSRKARKA